MVDNGSPGAAASLTGYSIVETNDIDCAKTLLNGHPYVSKGHGNYAIDVCE